MHVERLSSYEWANGFKALEHDPIDPIHTVYLHEYIAIINRNIFFGAEVH